MITREVLKDEIDRVQDKDLEVLYRIINALENSLDLTRVTCSSTVKTLKWEKFIETTYGCLFDDPIERGKQGQYEVREVIA